ncbi:MAG: tetratricopeptide repeat protein [Deltaproteobacteria bacterium]|nr:tetratricopeptide repeat protein [Deltaproteobacteria bacterium]
MTESHRETTSHLHTPVRSGDRKGRILPMIILVFVTLAVFGPVIGHQFLAYDDSVNVYKNPYFQARSLDNLLHFWRYPYEALYAPLTYTLWALTAWAPALLSADPSAAVAPDPRLFHSLNLLLHLLSVLIVWRILGLLLRRTRPTGTETAVEGTSLPLEWAACGGALLFAIHPIQVEPVAWATGFKDVLFGLLSLGAVWHYLRYVDARMQPGTGRPSRARLHYGLATGAFVLALLAKPTAVVLPLIVWLLAAWGRRRSWREQIADLSVWVIIAVAWGLLTRWVQPGTSLAFEPPLWARPLIAGDAVLFYLYKLVLPLRFGPDYGRTPQVVLEHGWLFLTGLAPFALAGWLWLKRKKLSWLVTAAGVFVVGLLPVLGLISFSFQRYSTVADRYAYLAMLGPAIALAWGLTRPKKKLAAICGAIVLGLFLLRSAWQIPYWHDTLTFFEHALQVNSNSHLAHNNLGFALAKQGQDVEAIRHYKEALRLEPESSLTHLNLGNAMARQGKLEEAIHYYTEALRIVPTYARAHTNLGLALARQGRYDEALERQTEALRIEPGFAEAHNNLANVLAHQGKFEEAAQHYTEALRLNPGYAEAHTNFGIAFAAQKRFDEAQHHFSEALRLEPNSAQAHALLADLLFQRGKAQEAEPYYIEAIRLNPRFKIARLRLSVILASQGKFDRAKHHVSEVLRIDPDHKAAQQILERIEYLDRTSGNQ